MNVTLRCRLLPFAALRAPASTPLLAQTLEETIVTAQKREQALESENWSAALFVRNLGDEEIIEFSSEIPLSNTLTGAPAFASYLQPPRTVSLQFDYAF